VGVVHQHVDAAQGGCGRLDPGLDLVGLAQVADHRVSGHAVGGEFGTGGLQRVGAPCADRYGSALCGEGGCDGAADAAAAAGDENVLSCKVNHGRCIFLERLFRC